MNVTYENEVSVYKSIATLNMCAPNNCISDHTRQSGDMPEKKRG